MLRCVLVGGLIGSTVVGGVADADTAGPACVQRVLVLSAMPVEIGPLLGRTQQRRTVTHDGHDFYLGRLQGRDVVLSLTGIGPVNARQVATSALTRFRCGRHSGISAVFFSGVAGGDFIGDVLVPSRWTGDAGKHFVAADGRLLELATRVARAGPALAREAPAGDPACGCVTSADTLRTVSVTHAPRIEVGGAGQTTDPFGGRALPCVPGGGDVFGCVPCLLAEQAARDASALASGAPAFADPAFLTGYGAPVEDSSHYVAEDEETAAVAAVAARQHVPFLGIRAVSDGGGDPLGLPGFPVQFFYYRQLAADNAATVAVAIVRGWHP